MLILNVDQADNHQDVCVCVQDLDVFLDHHEVPLLPGGSANCGPSPCRIHQRCTIVIVTSTTSYDMVIVTNQMILMMLADGGENANGMNGMISYVSRSNGRHCRRSYHPRMLNSHHPSFRTRRFWPNPTMSIASGSNRTG